MRFLIVVFTLLVMAGASISFYHSMDSSMTGHFGYSNVVMSMDEMQMHCQNPLCQDSLMGEISASECLTHCLSDYSSQLGSSSAIVPNGFALLLLVLVLFALFPHPKSSVRHAVFNRRIFSDIFNKLLLHRSLATVVIRD